MSADIAAGLPGPVEKLMGIVSSFWESRLVHTFAELGIADVLAQHDGPMSSADIAKELNLEGGASSAKLLYRMLRFLSIGTTELVKESSLDSFELTVSGAALQTDAETGGLRNVILLELGATHRRAWDHVEDLIREGEQNAFPRAWGASLFEYASNKSDAQAQRYREIFNNAMTGFSAVEAAAVSAVCKQLFSNGSSVKQVVDIGGGNGALAAAVKAAVGAERAFVTDLASVIDNRPSDAAGVEYQVLDMFESAVEGADLYVMKHILHDWNDEQCSKILSTIRTNAAPGASIIVAEYVVPGPGQNSGIAKGLDCHMMVACTGRERTFDEFKQLLQDAGFDSVVEHSGPPGAISVVQARVPDASSN